MYGKVPRVLSKVRLVFDKLIVLEAFRIPVPGKAENLKIEHNVVFREVKSGKRLGQL